MRESSSVPALVALADAFLLALASAHGADVNNGVTITGDGICAKCTLKEAPSCQNVRVVREGGKEVKYYLAKNKVANDFHHDRGICPATKGGADSDHRDRHGQGAGGQEGPDCHQDRNGRVIPPNGCRAAAANVLFVGTAGASERAPSPKILRVDPTVQQAMRTTEYEP